MVAVALVVVFAAHDDGRLQAQTLTDRQILEAFYTATNGDSWTTSTNWNDDNEDLDDWFGVQADDSDNVTDLSLLNNNLTGSIPSSLGGLSELVTLSLTSNSLTGSIPAELGNAGKLQFLALWDNDLTGSIPSELGKLSALRSLTLNGNELSGSIPSSLGNLSALTHMQLWDNQLTGSIPSELGNLTNMSSLGLYGNQLSGSIPSSLGNLSELQFLRLYNNQLTGTIPSELGNLSKLTTLQLYSNQLSGSIPSELSNAGSSEDAQGTRTDVLTLLSLSDNQLSGGIPPELGDLSALQYLLLNGNRLTGSIPSELGDLSNLLWLYLNGNRLTGSIPFELGNLGKNGSVDNLQYLVLWNNQLTGEIPSELGGLSSLQWLSLSQNKLSGSIPSSLGNLTSLIWLYLNENELTGSIPSQLGSLTSLTDLSLGHNELSGSIPTQLGSLTALTNLYLNNNKLTGSIPTQLGNLTSLQYLTLQNNELTGSIPSQLSSLTALIELYFHDNQLTGDVPNLNSLTSLVGLGLGGNDIDLDWSMFESGTDLKLDLASDSVWNASGNDRSMLYLYLHDSGLTGAIPDWLGANHTDLIQVWLHDNTLTGTVPTNFRSLTSLEELRLSGNSLTGGYSVLDGLGNLRVLIRDGAPGEQVFKSGVNSYFVKVAPVQDATQPKAKVTWTTVASDDVRLHLPPHPSISSVVEIVSAIDIEVVGDFTPPAVVCVPVPASTMVGDNQELLLLHESADGVWRVLESADPPSGYDPGAGNIAVCGITDSFSVFGVALVEYASVGTGAIQRILRIAPSIRSVTVSEGDVIRLRFDIYGRQDILDNELGIGHVFEWSDGGAGGILRSTDRVNEVVYTAPESPGQATVTVTAPSGACLSGDDADEVADRCTAKFIITVRRGSAVPEERPAPKNPIGEIPSVLVDAEGRQYEVLTPEGGGSFNGDDVTISADAGVVPNLEIVGVRADVGGSASNIGMTGQRYTLAGMWHEVRAVDANESAVSGYVLQSPLSVCLPLPDVLSSNISDVALVSSNADGTLTILASSVRITASGTRVCGGLGTLPASVAVGRLGSPAGLPTATPTADEVVVPDTGGRVPGVGVLVLLMVVGVAVVGVVVFGTRMRRGFEL